MWLFWWLGIEWMDGARTCGETKILRWACDSIGPIREITEYSGNASATRRDISASWGVKTWLLKIRASKSQAYKIRMWILEEGTRDSGRGSALISFRSNFLSEVLKQSSLEPAFGPARDLQIVPIEDGNWNNLTWIMWDCAASSINLQGRQQRKVVS